MNPENHLDDFAGRTGTKEKGVCKRLPKDL
jgi:hypothetical protein